MTHTVVIIDGRSGSGKTTLAAEFASRFSLPGQSAQTLHLDSLYPGWGGLASGSAAVAQVLEQQWYQPYDWAAGRFSASRIPLDPSRPLIIEGCGALTGSNLRAAQLWAAGSGRGRGEQKAGGARGAGAGGASAWGAGAGGAGARGADAGSARGLGAGGAGARGASAGSTGNCAAGEVRAIWIECNEELRRDRALARDGEMFAPHWAAWSRQERTHFSVHEPWLLADEIVTCQG